MRECELFHFSPQPDLDAESGLNDSSDDEWTCLGEEECNDVRTALTAQACDGENMARPEIILAAVQMLRRHQPRIHNRPSPFTASYNGRLGEFGQIDQSVYPDRLLITHFETGKVLVDMDPADKDVNRLVYLFDCPDIFSEHKAAFIYAQIMQACGCSSYTHQHNKHRKYIQPNRYFTKVTVDPVELERGYLSVTHGLYTYRSKLINENVLHLLLANSVHRGFITKNIEAVAHFITIANHLKLQYSPKSTRGKMIKLAT